MDLVKLEKINKTYKMGDIVVNALSDINLQVKYGEYIAILGPSGSGKSTLMNVLGCLDKPSSGKYFLDNRDVSDLSRNELATVRNQKIGFIFQSFNLLDYCSALENVALPLVYRGVSRSDRLARAREILEQVGLGDRVGHKPNELSGGQKQRVAVARALVSEPEVILADEPTGNLDSKSGEDVMNLFSKLSDSGKTIIVVTHDQKLAKRMRRVIEISDGKVKSDRGRG
jgi:putative ABC transport system ATP-binding protein